MTGSITFDSNSLQTFTPASNVGIITNGINHSSIPEKSMALYRVANANQSAIPYVDYPSKRITIKGVIKGSSASDLDDRIDTFKGYFIGKEKNLDINNGGATRRYIATANAVNVPERDGALLFVPFTVEFICTYPFGVETSATEFIDETGYTSATLNSTPTIGGTAPSQMPVFTITINSLTGTGDYIQLSNDNNGQEILIYGQSLAASDVLVIDSVNRMVTLNGTEIDYDGVFLEFDPGAQSITYTDGFDTRDVDIQAEYYKRYF